MGKLNYEQDLYIDDSALDLEWLQQPMLMLKYTEAAASARREVDRTKELLGIEKAELDKEIRKNPEKFDIEKITESIVISTIILKPSYKKIQSNLIDCQYEYQMLQGAVQAVEQRKQSLENMTKLLGLQYFAGPKMPRDIPYEVRRKEEKSTSNQSIKFKRRK